MTLGADPLPIPSQEWIPSQSHVISLSQSEPQNREQMIPLQIPSQEQIPNSCDLSKNRAQSIGSGSPQPPNQSAPDPLSRAD